MVHEKAETTATYELNRITARKIEEYGSMENISLGQAWARSMTIGDGDLHETKPSAESLSSRMCDEEEEEEEEGAGMGFACNEQRRRRSDGEVELRK
ncbi:hypothetical protein Csa_006841 [Cucumis sativus]|uniref:Uncharacterized protein n=1 Tax=Cucumis sativus TaxID=3659 RepID=A0A0A0M306_CUCSA|nr:hypothetical protein Csa_006841 [Cucumis sativus]